MPNVFQFKITQSSMQSRKAFEPLLTAMIAAFCVLGASSVAATNPVDKLADSALASALRTPDPDAMSRQIAAARLQVQTKAAQFPTEMSKARIVLQRAFAPADMDKLVTANALELTQVEAKLSVPGSDEVFTIILAGAALEGADGSVESRLKAAQRSAQAEFAKLALAESTSRAKFTTLSRSPLLFYSFEAIGSNQALASVSRSTDVSVVHPLQVEDAALEASSQRSLRSSMNELRTRSSLRQIVTAIPACQSSLTVDRHSPVTNAPSACPEEPIPEDPPTPTTALPATTGDVFVDSALAGANQYVDSYRDASGGPGKILLPAEGFFPCDSGVPGNRCPSDYAYTTRGLTGGTLAWGANVRQRGGPVGGVQCGLVYHWPQNDTVGRYSWECWWTVVDTPRWTYVTTAVRMSFGSSKVRIPRWVDANVVDEFPLSTFAWSGVPRTLGGGPAECLPNGSPILDVARPCQGYARDANFVIGQTGFEDKLLIPNPSCSPLIGRTGSSIDKNSGCFTPDRVITNLPTPYLDTTFGDSNSTYTSSVGVVDGKLLIPNFPYQAQIDGSAKGWENVRGLSARHVQAITVRDSAGVPCITGVGGAPAGGGAACMFNVDQVYVGSDGVFR